MRDKVDRLQFPEDESRLPWLAWLLESYAITDEGVGQGIRQAERRGHKLACGRGCAACCRSHGDIPVYPLELMGIYWYAVEKLQDPLRARVAEQLARYRELPGCPFLVDEACAIHPLRPMACRQFNVVRQVCSEGEDAFHTRPDDVLLPVKFHKEKALAGMLRHHGVMTESERAKLVRSGEVHRLAQNLRTLAWDALARRMTAGK